MSNYLLKFNLGTLPCCFEEPNGTNEFTKETNSELLKGYASTLIQSFKEIYIDGMESFPTSIELYRDGKLILDCDDLTEKSNNRANLQR